MMSVLRATLVFPVSAVLLFCVSVAAWGYGGGGGAEDNSLFPPPTAPSGQNQPPEGFTPPMDPVLTGLDPIDTTSVDSGDSVDDIEEAINQIADEMAKNPPDKAMTPRQRIEPYLDSLPPDVRQRLVSQFTPDEILTTIRIDNLEDMIAREKDPTNRSVLISALVGMKAEHARAVAARRKAWDKQKADARAIGDKAAKIATGATIGAIPGVGPALGVGFSGITGGTKGAKVSVATSVVTAPLKTNPLTGAVVSALVSETLDQATE